MKSGINLLTLLLLACHSALAQNPIIIDSLMKVLASDIPDTAKVKAYNRLAYEHISSDSAATALYTEKSREMAERIGYLRGIVVGSYYLGTMYWVHGYFQEAEQVLTQTKDLALSIDYTKMEGKCLMGLGTISSIQGDYLKAIGFYNRVEKIMLESQDNLGLAHVYNEKGMLHQNKGDYPNAFQYHFKALENYEAMSDKFGMARSYGNLAHTYQMQGNYSKAIANYFQCLEIFEDLGNKDAIATTYSYIGILFDNQDDLRKAREYYLKSLEINMELGNKTGISSDYANIGVLYNKEGDHLQALDYYSKSLEIDKEIGNKTGVATNYINIGSAHKELKEYSKALEYYLESYEIYEEIEAKADLTYSLISIGAVYSELQQPKKAKKYLTEGLQLAQELGYPINIRDGAEQLAIVEKKLGNYPAAYNALSLFKEMSDSLRNDELTKKLTRYEAEYEFQKEKDSISFEQQRANLVYEKEIARQTWIKYSLMLIAIFLALLAGVSYRSYVIKQRKNLELTNKNELIEVKNSELSTKNSEISELRETEKKMAKESLAFKERELTTVTMMSFEKNTLLQRLGDQIGKLTDKVDQRVLPDLKEIKRTIQSNLSEETWHSFTYHFEHVHPEFFEKLRETYSDLSQNDLKMCAYLKVGLDNKVIAQINNITVAGVKKSINRLKKKLALNSDENLRDFISAFA